MRVAFLLALAGVASAATKPWDGWDKTKSERWLEDHGVANPGGLNTEQLHKLVADNYDSVYSTWSDLQLRDWFASHGLLPPSPSPTPSGWFAKATDTVAATATDAASAADEQRKRMERAIRRSYDGSWESWDESDLKEWLQDQGVIAPPKSTREQLADYVGSYYDAVQSHLSSPPPSATDRAKQQFFAAYNLVPSADSVQDRLLSTWTDSQLRDYLLMSGVVNPTSKREELVVAVRQRMDTERKRLDRMREGASETISTAWYATTDAPKAAYDWTLSSLSDASDYVYSSWSDSDLREWLSENGVVAKPKSTRQELLDAIKTPFAGAATHSYDTWSDNALRTWLINHGVIRGKTATTRDELLDLLNRNYYGARDTTFHLWSDNAMRRWLESRGLIRTDAQKTRDDLLAYPRRMLEIMEENYYKLRDMPYQAWDSSTAREWLVERGYIKTPYEAKRDEVLDLLSHYWHTSTSYVWDTWSDAEERAWLVKEGVLTQTEAADKKRSELEGLLEENWHKGVDNLSHSWSDSDMRQWLVDHGVLKSQTEKKKDEVLDLFRSNYKAATKKTTEYTSWSDNRVRAWLREHGVDVPMNSRRDELLQTMKENYISSTGTIAGVFETVQDYVEGGVKGVKDYLERAKVDREVSQAEKSASASADAAIKSASSAAAAAKASADKARQEL